MSCPGEVSTEIEIMCRMPLLLPPLLLRLLPLLLPLLPVARGTAVLWTVRGGKTRESGYPQRYRSTVDLIQLLFHHRDELCQQHMYLVYAASTLERLSSDEFVVCTGTSWGRSFLAVVMPSRVHSRFTLTRR